MIYPILIYIVWNVSMDQQMKLLTNNRNRNIEEGRDDFQKAISRPKTAK